MPSHRSAPLLPFPCSFSKLSILASLILAFVTPTRAVPLPASFHRVPDLWAQLLHAGRFKLFPSPTWVTRGHQPVLARDNSFPQPPLAETHPSSSNLTRNPFDLNLSVRQKTITVDKAKSKFVCHVFNQPPNLNVDAIILRVLTIASQSWLSDQDVLMKVNFRDLGEPSVLANGGGTYFVRMSDTFDTVLPVAAAEAIRKADLNGNEPDDGKYDVLATVNRRTPWYNERDGKPPPDRYDLVTVLLHEIYHNLVFAGSVTATYQRVPNSDAIIQSASIHKGYLTRFDSFLMNEGNCAVLGYLTDEELSKQLNRPTPQLLADAVCNDRLYWGYGQQKVAKLFSPRLFQNKSSIYHFDPRMEDPQESLMFPTVRIGSAQHVVGPKILQMQAITLDPSIPGAYTGCPRPLQNPTPNTAIQPEHFTPPSGGLYDGLPLVLDNRYGEEGRRRIGGLPVWAFALLIVFAILLALLLLGLCIALLLKLLGKNKRKKKGGEEYTSSSSSYPTTKQGPTSRTSSSSRRKTYIPGMGSIRKSKKTRTSSSSRTSRYTPTTSVEPTSKHTSTTRKTSSKHTTEPKPVTCRTPSKRYTTCPSSGKSKYLCYCKCCRSSITPPEPVASVHTFDPDSVPTCHKHKSTRRSGTHKHLHSCHKTVKKTCKSKSMRSCSYSCYCCRYKPSSCKTSSTCCKSTKASSSRCPPSTKPPSTKPPSTKVASSSKHCCSSKYCSSKYSSSKSCSCSKSASKLPSTKPPSTKPPVKASSSKSCKTCKVSCKTCKPSGSGCACTRCEQVVEINIC